MWNLKPASKITEERVRHRNYQLHLHKLSTMNSKIKIKAPIQPQFIYTNSKQQFNRKQRLDEIDKQNEILLKKLNSIRQNKFKNQEIYSKSNSNYNQLNQRIFQQNKVMCKKLINSTSHYPLQNIIHSTQFLNQVKINLSENARRNSPYSWNTINNHRPFTTKSKAHKKFISSAKNRPMTCISRPKSSFTKHKSSYSSHPLYEAGRTPQNHKMSIRPQSAFFNLRSYPSKSIQPDEYVNEIDTQRKQEQMPLAEEAEVPLEEQINQKID